MAAAFRVAASGADAAGGTTRATGSVAVQTGDTAYVWVFSSDGTPVIASGVVWDPGVANQALTQIHDSGTRFTYGRVTLWRAQGLTAKTATFQATWGSTQGERGIVAWLGTGIDTTTPNGTIATGTNTNTSVSVTATGLTTSQLVLGAAWALDIDGTAISFNFSSPNGTERAEAFASPYDIGAMQDIAAGGTTQAITWTVSGTTANYQGWYGVALGINDAGAGPTPEAFLTMPPMRSMR